MSKARNTDIVPQKASGELMQVPEYLQTLEHVGLESMKEYVRPSRVKLVQKQSSNELLEEFGMGSAILTPNMMKLADGDTPMLFTPVFFYPEFCIHNPYEMRSQLRMIRERTLDARSEIALRARDPNRRTAPCPEKSEYAIRYVEHLNFIVLIHGVEGLTDEAAVMTFALGEANTGMSFCSRIRSRKTAMFSGVYQGVVSLRPERNGNQWYGWDISNPPADVNPWVTAEQAEAYGELYKMFAEKHEQQLIDVSYEDTEDDVANAANTIDC